MTDPVHELLDEAIAARRSAAVLSLRQQRELLVTQSFDAAFADELADAYEAALPPEHTRKLYAKLFEEFRDWLRPVRTHHPGEPLPVTNIAADNVPLAAQGV